MSPLSLAAPPTANDITNFLGAYKAKLVDGPLKMGGRRPSPLRRNISAALWRGRPQSRSRPSQPRRRDRLC
jgi:hypothetical protein